MLPAIAYYITYQQWLGTFIKCPAGALLRAAKNTEGSNHRMQF